MEKTTQLCTLWSTQNYPFWSKIVLPTCFTYNYSFFVCRFVVPLSWCNGGENKIYTNE